MNKVKSFFRLLCFLFIAIFMIGFGGENVFAIDAHPSIRIKKGETWIGGSWPSYVKYTTIDNQRVYAFCLDSHKNIYYNDISLDSNLYSNKRDKVSKIISKAYEFGLGNGESTHSIVTSDDGTYNVSEKKLYGITQAAVWKAIHGTGTDGYTLRYRNWIKSNGYESIFNDIYSGSTVSKKDYSVTLSSNGDESVVEDGNYLVSNDYTVVAKNVPSSVSYSLTIDGGEVSVNNGEWKSSNISVKNGDTVKIRMAKQGNTSYGELSSSVSLSSSSFITGYKAYFYNAGKPYRQNIGIILPETSSVSTSKNFKGSYDDIGKVQFKKVDEDTGEKVAGATLSIYKKSDNSFIDSVISTAGSSNTLVSLPEGSYYVKETVASYGYILNDTAVDFDVVKESGVYVIKQNGQTVDSATITLQNRRSKIRFRKVDENNNPIEGVQISIYNKVKEMIHLDGSLYMSATSCSDGYFRTNCNDESTGNFDIEFSNNLYYIKETFPQGYYVKNFDDNTADFYLTPTEFILGNDYLSMDGTLGEDAVVTLNIINSHYIDISKTDLGGNELPGASMKLYDMENRDYYSTSEVSPDDSNEDQIMNQAPYAIVDEWVSGDEPHRFVGIVPGRRYLLKEEVAPEGYVRITTDIEFSMDVNGNVTVYSNNGSVNTDSYKLSVMNDYTKVSISKVDVTTNTELPGAELMVCTPEEVLARKGSNLAYEDYDCAIKWTSTNEPHQIDMLKAWGEGEGKAYLLIETIAPAGYAKKTSAVSFYVLNDSGIQTVKFENRPIKIMIAKKDKATGDRLAGATLQILNASDRSIAKDNTGAELTWVSKADEDWEITGIPVGDYILVETVTPEGYEEGMEIDNEIVQEYAFTITGNEDLEIELYIPVINVPKTGLSALNLFAIGGLMIFAGYETIKIYRRRRVNA